MVLYFSYELNDGTEVSLTEQENPHERCGETEFRFSLAVNGAVQCRYCSFQYAWEDFGVMVRCTTLEELNLVATC